MTDDQTQGDEAWPIDRQTLNMIRQSRDPVLIVGPLDDSTAALRLARSVHEGGPRRAQAFFHTSCAGLPADVLRSELFGHAIDPSVGRFRPKRGLAELADGGTLCLLHVNLAPPEVQTQLRRLVEHGEVTPDGTAAARHVDVRVIGIVIENETALDSAIARLAKDFQRDFAMIVLRSE